MKKALIFLTIFIISFFAFLDAKKLITELKNVSYARTPSQIEIRPLINEDRGASSNVNYDPNQNYLHNQMRNETDHSLQNSIDKMNNHCIRNIIKLFLILTKEQIIISLVIQSHFIFFDKIKLVLH